MKAKNYLLFLYGRLGNSVQFAGFIHSIFEPISDEAVKYVQDRSSAICHFSSEENVDTLTEYFNFIMDEEISAFVLMEKPPFMGMRMDEEMVSHLMDLNFPPGYPFGLTGQNEAMDEEFLRWSEKQIQKLGLDDNLPPPYDEEDSAADIRKIREHYKAPLYMDAILDKIAQSGYTSLTEEEKKYLKNLSK